MRIAVLVSGSGTNLQALIDACARPDFPAEIAVVISNKEEAYGLERARAAHLQAVHIPHRGWGSRAAFEDRLTATLRESEDTLAKDGETRDELERQREEVMHACDEARSQLADRDALAKRTRSALERVLLPA